MKAGFSLPICSMEDGRMPLSLEIISRPGIDKNKSGHYVKKPPQKTKKPTHNIFYETNFTTEHTLHCIYLTFKDLSKKILRCKYMQSHASLMQSPFETIRYNIFCKYKCSNTHVCFLSLPSVLCIRTLPGIQSNA